MTVSLSMLGGAGWQFFDNNGDPLSGGLLYTYDAGTTTPRATYTSSSGGTANANPIVLDSAGRTPQEVWLTNGVLYKFVLKTSADVLIGTYDNISGQGFYEDLASALAASSGSSLVGFIGAGSGAVAQTVQDKLRQIVHVDDYDGDIAAAVAALPAEGGEVHFSAATYISPYLAGTPMVRDNITFRGVGRPDFNSGYTALEGGTIIIGPFIWRANGCTFTDLGIDVGSAACTTYFGGVAQEGLLSANPGTLYKNNTIRNVSVICKAPTAAVHAILFESQTEGTVENIATVYAASGFVIKGSRINVDGVYARSHRNYSVLAKSDAGGLCDSINYNNIIVDTTGDPSGMIPGNGANWDTNGFVLLPVTSGGTDYPVTNITASNLVLKNCINGIEFDTTAGAFTDAVKGVTITNVVTENHFFTGATIEQYSNEVRVSNMVSRTSDYGILNAGDDVIFDNVTSIQSNHNCFANNGGTDVVYNNCTADEPYSINFAGFENNGGQSIVRTPNYGPAITTNKTNNSSGTQTIEDIAVLNQQTSTILGYLRRQLITQIEAVTGAGSVVAAYFGTDDTSATTMADWSTYGTHTATFRDAALTPEVVQLIGALGMGNEVSYNAAHLWDTPDAANLSFGNGATDSPFSVMSLCKPLVSFIGQIAAKYDATTASPQREWYFQLTSSSGLYFNVTDNSTGGYLMRRDSNSLAPYDNVWTTFTGTYSGSATAAGLKVYINDTETTNSDISSGSYTAMENTTAKVGSYQLNTSGASQYGLYANVACTLIFNVQLSAANVIAVRSLLTNYFGV